MPPPTRTALITGVAGQDGVYLARHLRAAGYRVVGTVRPGSARSPVVTAYLGAVELHEVDHRDGATLAHLLETLEPDEVYNLAALTSVAASWEHAELVTETNAVAVLRLLESLVRFRDRHGWAPRLLQPSSSEMFGVADHQPQTESTPHHPRSPYAASKSFAHHLTVNYRESYGLHASTVTLYNHESPLRPRAFVTRKIARSAAEIALGRRETLTLGNLDVRRDWGHAADHVRAMHLVAARPDPGDVIVATGVSHSLSELLHLAFAAAGVDDVASRVRQDPALMRPADVVDLYGDATKAREELGWSPTIGLPALVEHLVQVDLRRLRSGVEDDPVYLDPRQLELTPFSRVGA